MFSWLANPLTAPILLILCLILGVSTTSEAFRIYGLNLFGWQAVDGYESLLSKATDSARRIADDCTKATADLKTAGEKAQAQSDAKAAEAEKALAAEQASNAQLNTRLRGLLNNAKPSDTRALGPVTLQYLDSLRNQPSTDSQGTSHTGSEAQH